MFPAPRRRDVLRLLLAGAGLSGAHAWAAGVEGMGRQAAAPRGASRPVPEGADHRADTPLTVTPLTDTLAVIAGAGGNVVVALGPESVLMVNGGRAERAADVASLIARHSGGKRVELVFNTDWHPEHSGSNERLAKGGTQILAHEFTRQYMSEDLFVEWQQRNYRRLPAPALPSKTFQTAGSVTFAGRRVEYRPLGQAHTDGDVAIFFPDANVLVAGDVLSVGAYPIADYTTGGWLGGLANATKALLDLGDASTRIVPGVGPVQTRDALQAQLDMLTAMRERLVKMMKQGMGAEDMLAASVTKEYDAVWGSPELFVATAYRGLWLHVRELGGIV